MTRYLGATDLLAVSFVRSGLHTLALDDVRRYGMLLASELKRRSGDSWVVRWGERYASEIPAGFAVLDDDVAELRCSPEAYVGVLDGVCGEVVEASSAVEWVWAP